MTSSATNSPHHEHEPSEPIQQSSAPTHSALSPSSAKRPSVYWSVLHHKNVEDNIHDNVHSSNDQDHLPKLRDAHLPFGTLDPSADADGKTSPDEKCSARTNSDRDVQNTDTSIDLMEKASANKKNENQYESAKPQSNHQTLDDGNDQLPSGFEEKIKKGDGIWGRDAGDGVSVDGVPKVISERLPLVKEVSSKSALSSGSILSGYGSMYGSASFSPSDSPRFGSIRQNANAKEIQQQFSENQDESHDKEMSQHGQQSQQQDYASDNKRQEETFTHKLEDDLQHRLNELQQQHHLIQKEQDKEQIPILPTRSDSESTHHRKWSLVREVVQTEELFIHTSTHSPRSESQRSQQQPQRQTVLGRLTQLAGDVLPFRMSLADTKEPPDEASPASPTNSPTKRKSTMDNKWSDLITLTPAYEFTLFECLLLFISLLLIGILAYSFVFERWPILDSIYFTLVCLTTVGYGDYTPTTPSGKVFASVFALGGVLVLGLALGVVGSQLVETEIKYSEKMRARAEKVVENAFAKRRQSHVGRRGHRQNTMSTESGSSSTHPLLSPQMRSNSSESLMSLDSAGSIRSDVKAIESIFGKSSYNKEYDACDSQEQHRSSIQDTPKLQNGDKKVRNDFIGRCCRGFENYCPQTYAKLEKKLKNTSFPLLREFAMHLPGFLPMLMGSFIMARLEDWGWYDAIYYCVVTATTIGFGDLTPQRTIGKVFAVFFVPISVATLGYILGNLASFIVDKRRDAYTKKLWSCELTVEDIEALDTDHDGSVSELEYIRFMLVAMKKIDGELFDELHKQFIQLDMTGDGKITKRDLQIMAARKIRSVSNKLALSEYKHFLQDKSKKHKRGSSVFQVAIKKMFSQKNIS